MQSGAAAGAVPPHPGHTANPCANSPLWFYYLLKSCFLRSDLGVSLPLCTDPGRSPVNIRAFPQEPAEVSEHASRGTALQLTSRSPSRAALPQTMAKDSGCTREPRGPATTLMLTALELLKSRWDRSWLRPLVVPQSPRPHVPSHRLRRRSLPLQPVGRRIPLLSARPHTAFGRQPLL